MRQPSYALTGNLRFTRQGTVWADFLLDGLPYRLRRHADKEAVRVAHTGLVRALPGEALLLGFTADESPELIVQRMMAGVRLEDHPVWMDECEATLDGLARYRPGTRVYWLSVPLTGEGWREQVHTAGRAIWHSAAEFLGLPRSSVPADELMRRVDQAHRVKQSIPAMFDPQPTSPAQAVWLWGHALHRGLLIDPDVPVADDTPEYPEYKESKAAGALMAARIDEGALSDRPEKGLRSKLPTYDTVLKIDTPWEAEAPPSSYQTVSVITDTPSGGTTFPGSEFFFLAEDIEVDGVPVDVDFAIRLNTRSGGDVLRRNRKALKVLNDQFNQREGELTTGRNVLDEAAEALAEYSTELEADKNEIEVGWTALFVTAGTTAKLATEAAEALNRAFAKHQFRVSQPLGFQEDLWWAMMPGTPAPRVLSEFTQITTSSKFGAFVPVTNEFLGDPTGPLLAFNTTTPVYSAVHYDVSAKTEADVSNSLGVTGELGSGKSVLIKTIAGHIIFRGGQGLFIDQSALGEYRIWGSPIPGAVVVDMVNSHYSLDPLLLFPGQEGSDQAERILGALLRLGVRRRADLKTVLNEVLSARYRAEHPYTGTGGLVRHLTSGDCPFAGAEELGRDLATHARRTYAAALFDDTLPPLPIDAPAIVFRTHQVSLPSREKMAKEHSFMELPPEQQYGHAIYAYIATLARGILYSDPTRTAVLGCDEAAHLVEGADGLEMITDVVKRGRKENAAVLLGDQDCQFGGEELRGLLKTRIAMRHTDNTLARRALEWVGLDPDAGDLLEQYTKNTSPIIRVSRHTNEKPKVAPERRGEGYMRDASGETGRVKILAPFYGPINKATLTTPNATHTPTETVPV